MKKILPVIAVPIVALGLVGASASASPDHHQGGFQLTGKVLDVAQLDLDKPGQSLGDEQIITMDVFQGDTRVGESHVACTLVRVEEATHAFTAQCDNVTSLPAGQITAQGLVTSAQEETTPFIQAITGGTGAFQRARGQLTVDEAGPQPAKLTFDLAY